MKKIFSLMALIALIAFAICAQAEALDSASVADTVAFGNYEQGNGQAPIEWIVLDRQEDRALLLSKYALDAMSFHEVEDWNVTWADCTLRSWLKAAGVQMGQADRQNRNARRERELEAEVRALRKKLAEKDEVIELLKKSIGIISKP